MILQALYEYYQRKAADPESGIAPEGFEWKEIPFLIVIDKEGRFVRLEDTRDGEGKKKKAKIFLVPQGEKKASGIKANLLWDGPEYIVGANPRARDDVKKRHAAFIDRYRSAFASHLHDPNISAMLKFIESDAVSRIEASATDAGLWKELLESNANISIRIEDTGHSIISDDISDFIDESSGEENTKGICLIRGEADSIPNLNPSIKGVRNAQPTGAALVSFNLPAFRSYGKEQNINAPIGEKAVFAYTTALNTLLASESNRMQLGDSTTVFWAQKKDTAFEKVVKSFFFAPGKLKDDPDRDALDAKQNLLSLISGIPPDEMETKFYILGLSPNAARVSVRFWHQGSIGDFCAKMRQHFDDLDIVAPPYDQCRMSLQYLLGSTVLDWKSENIPPNLAGNVMRAVLNGSPYPETFANQCLRRVRAESDVTRVRASIIKACLNRKMRIVNSKNEKEMAVGLDPSNMNVGYRLGRLFAVLEKIQEDANPGINATIRDRFYGAASSNPVAVFPQLLKLKNHHLSKIENQGFKIAHEKRLAEIFDGLPGNIPAHLVMDDQARFAIGYYHQRQALFTSNKENTKGEEK
jgi:CRISPR-associated protein Csd1